MSYSEQSSGSARCESCRQFYPAEFAKRCLLCEEWVCPSCLDLLFCAACQAIEQEDAD